MLHAEWNWLNQDVHFKSYEVPLLNLRDGDGNRKAFGSGLLPPLRDALRYDHGGIGALIHECGTAASTERNRNATQSRNEPSLHGNWGRLLLKGERVNKVR